LSLDGTINGGLRVVFGSHTLIGGDENVHGGNASSTIISSEPNMQSPEAWPSIQKLLAATPR
jgi:hypothetical protein